MADKRKINFFEILISPSDSNARECIQNAVDQILLFNETMSRERQKPVQYGGGLMQVTSIKEMGHYLYGHSKIIREEFPEISDKNDDTITPIEAENDPSKGIHEETHFVISRNTNYRYPLIAVESSLKGPKYGDIKRYFNSMLIHSGFRGEFEFEPCYAFNYDEFLNRIRDVAKITLKFHRDDIQGFSSFDPDTGQLVRNALDYGATEYISMEFGINFQRQATRYPTDRLKERVIHFINLFRTNPDAKNYIRKLDVKAQDRNFNGRLRLFDLIESKVASEVPAERKRPRSQYYNSNELYGSIRAQIEKDFGV